MMKRLDYLYGEDRPMSFRTFDIHLLSYEEMKVLMQNQGIKREDIYENTIEIANKIEEYNIVSNLDLLPANIDNPHQGLVDLVLKGMVEKGLYDKPEYKERMQEELDIIRDKNFSSYFLIVSNMLNWAKSQGILVGPGRGSAAGSLVCYALGITDVDPLEYGLLFFRFINPERIHVEVNGTGGDLMNLFANVINDNEDLAEVIKMAIVAVDMKSGKLNEIMEKMGLNPSDEELIEQLAQNPPVAEA